jgi:hypothetical protein
LLLIPWESLLQSSKHHLSAHLSIRQRRHPEACPSQRPPRPASEPRLRRRQSITVSRSLACLQRWTVAESVGEPVQGTVFHVSGVCTQRYLTVAPLTREPGRRPRRGPPETPPLTPFPFPFRDLRLVTARPFAARSQCHTRVWQGREPVSHECWRDKRQAGGGPCEVEEAKGESHLGYGNGGGELGADA